MNYPIPVASAQAFAKRDQTKPQNPGLIFDRFAPDWSADSTLKKTGLETVRQSGAKADVALLAAWRQRREAATAAVNALTFTLATDWRFIPGLGRKGPLEVGFAFHRYGLPILPGSSVKGIARAYATLVEKLDESHPDFVAIFGRAPKPGEDESQAQSGQAVFYDAIPAQLPRLELDVMNPHFPDYYQGRKLPTDGQNPIPVYFLTVAPDMPFCFAVGWRGPLDAEGQRRRDLAREWLTRGLIELGAGAKTSAGYGYFQSQAPIPATGAPAPTLPKAVVSPTPPVPEPVTVLPRKSGLGKVRYDRGTPWIVDQADPTKRLRVDWRGLGMDNLADKTPVEYEYEETAEAKWRLVRVAKKK